MLQPQSFEAMTLKGLHTAQQVKGIPLCRQSLSPGRHQNLARTRYEVGGEGREVLMFYAEMHIYKPPCLRSFFRCSSQAGVSPSQKAAAHGMGCGLFSLFP